MGGRYSPKQVAVFDRNRWPFYSEIRSRPWARRTRSAKKRLVKINQAARMSKKGFMEKINGLTQEIVGIARETMKAARISLDEARRILEELSSKAGCQTHRAVTVLNRTMCLRSDCIQQACEVIKGNRKIKDRIVSVRDPGTRPIVKGKAGKRTEFGRKVCITETKEGFVSHYEVKEGNPPNGEMVIDATKGHEESTGSLSKTLTADPGMSGTKVEEELKDIGVNNVVIPRNGRKSKAATVGGKALLPLDHALARGIEGRIIHLKRCYGLRLSLMDNLDGTRCWVELPILWPTISYHSSCQPQSGYIAPTHQSEGIGHVVRYQHQCPFVRSNQLGIH
jgi:IS5 family transposase